MVIDTYIGALTSTYSLLDAYWIRLLYCTITLICAPLSLFLRLYLVALHIHKAEQHISWQSETTSDPELRKVIDPERDRP